MVSGSASSQVANNGTASARRCFANRDRSSPDMCSGIVFLSELQKLQKFPECNFASRKGNLLRLKRTISHPNGERFTPAANLPFPCSVTTVGNDDMKFIAQQD